MFSGGVEVDHWLKIDWTNWNFVYHMWDQWNPVVFSINPCGPNASFFFFTASWCFQAVE